MKRLVLASAAMALAAIAATTTDNPFQTRLSADRRIVHVLNRLTFGPRPGDVDEVRKAGVEKWIDLQLHPDRISENPALDAKLKPLETLRMEPAQIIKDYSPMRVAPPFTPLTELLPGDQFRKVMNGTAEQRQKAIAALDPEKRSKVLAMLQPDTLEGLPELQKEAVYKYNQIEVERQRKLFAAGVTSRDTLDQAEQSFANSKADYDSAVASTQTQKQQLGYYRLTAPFDGVVGDIAYPESSTYLQRHAVASKIL